MIVKMQKLTALVYHREYDAFLSQLQELGVVHIQAAQEGTPEPDSELACQMELSKRTEAIIAKLTPMAVGEITAKESEETAETLVNEAEALLAKQVTLQGEEKSLQQQVNLTATWGEYDVERVKSLLEIGYQMQFWTCMPKSFNLMSKSDEEAYAFPIAQDGSTLYFVTVSPSDHTPQLVEATPMAAPEVSHKEAVALFEENKKAQQEVEQQIKAYVTTKLAYLKHAQNQLSNSINLAQVQLTTAHAAADHLMVLEGWVPTDSVEHVNQYMATSGAYYEVREPRAEDNVPIKLRNNWFARKFEVLTSMYGMPDYNEWDPTPILAPFFTLFFAICMGDAGYGIIILLYGLLETAGKGSKVPIVGEMLKGCGPLVTILGAATLVVGLALGSFFSLNIASMDFVPEGIKSYYAFVQGNFPGTNFTFQMVGALIIGVFHICLALIFKAIVYTKKEGFASQLSSWGWVLLIVGGIITATMFMMGSLSQDTTTYILIGIGAVSALGIFLLNNVGKFKKNPVVAVLTNPLAGLYDTYNMASGLMGDVLSYIRLYALCLAGAKLGEAFNNIGDMLPIYGGIFIYIIGHVLNLLLSAISAFVHPLRLNFVEYFKNLGYNGLGTTYKPFEKTKK